MNLPDDVSRIAELIDQTLLRPESTRSDIEQLCAEGREYRFWAICVNPVWVPLCRAALAGSGVRVASVVAFPFGAGEPESKAAEAALAVREGADEADMVAAIGHIKSGDWGHVATEIRAVVQAARGRPVKVIIESAVLDPEEITRASVIAAESGAAFVKTSTGFHHAGGATEAAVRRMREAVGDGVGVKASGGIRDCAAALRMFAAGASRVGTSSGVAIAQCLGADPTPLRELVALPALHATRCTTAGVAASGGAVRY